MSRMFGLTARAAAVVCALADGDDSRAIAARLGIGLETVRTHLKQAMQIVGVKRQAELVKAVVSSPAWIAAPRRGQPRPRARPQALRRARRPAVQARFSRPA